MPHRPFLKILRTCLTDNYPLNNRVSQNLKGIVPLHSHREFKVEKDLFLERFLGVGLCNRVNL